MKRIKRLMALLLVVFMVCTILPVDKAEAKTHEAQSAKTVFFYVTNNKGEDVLIRAADISELQALTQKNKKYYSFSYTDNLPTTCYAEAEGFTTEDLINYLNEKTGASLTFQGQDRLSFMADDSGQQYNRFLIASEAAKERKYVPGLYEGWKTYGADRWEDEADSKVQEYKKKAWQNGEAMPVIFSTNSFCGRTTESDGTDGIENYVKGNGGVVKGCLSKASVLNGKTALTMYMPTTEDSFMAGGGYDGRTAYSNFRWIYSIKLSMEQAPATTSKGTVEKVKAAVTQSQDKKKLTITLSCPTEGASIYYDLGTGKTGNMNKSAQTLYDPSKPIEIDAGNMDFASNPITFYTRAVKEGYTDAGNQTMTYHQSPPNITKPEETMLGEKDVVLTANKTVSDSEWNDWSKAITGFSVKLTKDEEYKDAKYQIDAENKTITLSKDNFKNAGTYVICAKAKEYKDAKWNASVLGRMPKVKAQQHYDIKKDVTLTFDDSDAYHEMDEVKCKEVGAEKGVSIYSSYLTKAKGKLTIKSSYFKDKKTGDYTLTLTNSNYDPEVQDVTITVIDEAAVSNAETKITAIGTVGKNSGAAIKAARTAYDGLTTNIEKKLVTNFQVLQEAEASYEPLVVSQRAESTAKLENYKNPNAYRQAQKTELEKMISQANASIQQANYIEDINAVVSSAMKKMDALKTDAQLKKEEAVSKMKKSLGTVTGVKVSSSSYNTAKISWSKRSAAAGYQIYRAESKSGTYRRVAAVNSRTLSYTNKSLKTGTTYYYKVVAYASVSGQTVTGFFSSPRAIKPALKKTSTQLKAGKKQALVKWKKVSGASGYQVYRSLKKSSSYKRVKTITRGSTAKYTNKKLKKGKRYYYKVRAYRKVSGRTVYASFSSAKSVKVK